MIGPWRLALAPLLMAGAAAAQPEHAHMPGMTHPPAAHASPPAPVAAADAEAPDIPQTPPPPAPSDYAAEQFYDPGVMAAARRQLRLEHGGAATSMVLVDQAEYRRQGEGEDGYAWSGEAWYGGDIHRLVLKTDGEGLRGHGVESAELQALYSRAIGPYFNLQAGLRHDVRPRPSRTFATAGVEGLAPYWFEVEAAVFLSDRGELLAEAEGSYDLRLTQRLILQPKAEVRLAAQDGRDIGVGSGVSDIELGLRLRYEARRELAPYVGIVWARSFGRTADFARQAGEGPETTSLVAGVRAWF